MNARGLRRRIVLTAASIVTIPALLFSASGVAEASTGRVGQYGVAQCGWLLQDAGGLNGYRITLANLPWVTGTTSSPQTVWVHAQFMYAGGKVYRDGWFYTTARAGVWTKTWTSYSNGQRASSVQDALGESGTTNVAMDTFVLMSMFWMTGTTITGTASEWAWSATSSQNANVCDGGAWIG